MGVRVSRKLHAAGEQLNPRVPAALALAALLTVAQLWGHIHWLWMNQCKFPMFAGTATTRGLLGTDPDVVRRLLSSGIALRRSG